MSSAPNMRIGDPPLLGPYTENDPLHHPRVMCAYLAGVTQRLGMATGILILTQRQTELAAKQTLDLALFSRNRFRLGWGAGDDLIFTGRPGPNPSHLECKTTSSRRPADDPLPSLAAN